MKKLALIDFDDTLFNTAKFKQELEKFFSQKYDADFFEQYEQAKNEHGAYDYFKHLELIGVTASREKDKQDFFDYFQEIDFQFTGTQKLIDKLSSNNFQIIILTLGFDDFQKMKFKLIAELNSLRMHSIETDKADFLTENITPTENGLEFSVTSEEYQQIIFIDDKPKSFVKEEIENLENYRIRRPS